VRIALHPAAYNRAPSAVSDEGLELDESAEAGCPFSDIVGCLEAESTRFSLKNHPMTDEETRDHKNRKSKFANMENSGTIQHESAQPTTGAKSEYTPRRVALILMSASSIAFAIYAFVLYAFLPLGSPRLILLCLFRFELQSCLDSGQENRCIPT
jgi:hypothetical protein